jgi:DNA-binding MltR family transcriptional regulator
MVKVARIPIEQLSEQTAKLYEVLNEEKDLAVILIGTGFVDACLKSLLEAQFLDGSTSERLLQPSGAVGGFRVRADLCYVLGLITKSEHKNLVTLGEIRNRVAHHHLDIDFSDAVIEADVASLTVHLKGYLADVAGRTRFTLCVVLLANRLILNTLQLNGRGEKTRKKEPEVTYKKMVPPT